MRIILIFLISSFLLSCGSTKSESKNPMQGGQDVGGGSTLASTREDLDAALFNAKAIIKDFTGPAHFRNPLPAMVKRMRGTDLEEIAMKVFYPKGWPDYSDELSTFENVYAINSYFFESTFIIEEKGACSSPDNKHADASVSAHQIGANICISVENLLRIPRPSLFKEVLSLLIHEAAHLVGLREVDAIRLQKKISEELLEIETFYDINLAIKAVRSNQEYAIKLLEYAQSLYKVNPQDPRIYFVVSEAITHLTWLMPDFKHPLLFQAAVGKDIDKILISIMASRMAWAILWYRFGAASAGGDVKRPNPAFLEGNEFSILMYGPSFMIGKNSGEALGGVIDMLKQSLASLNRRNPVIN